MAYNPYFPVTYQPIYQQPVYPQQSYQAAPQPQNPVVPQAQQSGMIWVNSGIEAQAYPVAPNAAVTLWSTAEPVVYLKKADASGRPTLITYDLVERKDQPVSKAEPKPDYATKEDLSTVATVVKGYEDIINGLKADLETMKGDLYGLSGRKKRKENDVDE